MAWSLSRRVVLLDGRWFGNCSLWQGWVEFEFSFPRSKRGGVGKEESKTPTFPVQIEKYIYIDTHTQTSIYYSGKWASLCWSWILRQLWSITGWISLVHSRCIGEYWGKWIYCVWVFTFCNFERDKWGTAGCIDWTKRIASIQMLVLGNLICSVYWDPCGQKLRLSSLQRGLRIESCWHRFWISLSF